MRGQRARANQGGYSGAGTICEFTSPYSVEMLLLTRDQVSFLNNIVMPDPSLDDDSDSEADADDQEEANGGDEDGDESS